MASQINETTEAGGSKRFRLIVSSAEEAVKVIREKLGDKAKVISVKQIDGQGLARFLTSPKLEVIVTVPNEVEQKAPVKDFKENKEKQEAPDFLPIKSEKSNESTAGNSDYKPKMQAGKAYQPQNESEETKRSREVIFKSKSSLSQILSSAGFDQELMNRLESHPQWEHIQKLPIAHALSDISSFLKSEFSNLKVLPRTNKVAFIGTPGVGKTTALCKLLVNEVFFNQNRVHVLKLDSDVPNSDDALRVFCEVLGVSLCRHSDELKDVSENDLIFYDIPGVCLDSKNWSQVGEKLDLMGITSRVLVLNAAYDTDVLKKSIHFGIKAKSSHMIFTHVDELSNPTKLWSFVFGSGLTSLLLCHGQSITDDFSENIVNYLLTHTFPRHLLSN